MTRFTIEDMEKFAAEAWGELGVNVRQAVGRVQQALLKPVPLVI